jgi:outer membrane protein assembly factor BamD
MFGRRSRTYVERTDPADVLYNQGLANLNAGRLGEASKKFEAVDRQHPYSEYARKSLVMGAFSSYRQGNYVEAINAGKRYVQLYPSTSDAAYAQYIVGLSYFRQIADVTRDQKESAAPSRRWKRSCNGGPIGICRRCAGEDPLCARPACRQGDAGRPLLSRTPRIYRRRQTLPLRRRELFQHPPCRGSAGSPHRSLLLDGPSEAQAAAAVLGQNYPDSQWYKDLYKLLSSQGLQPRENAGSWITKAGKLITGA